VGGETPCTDDAVLIEKSTMVDDGGNEQPPLPTLGILSCGLHDCRP